MQIVRQISESGKWIKLWESQDEVILDENKFTVHSVVEQPDRETIKIHLMQKITHHTELLNALIKKYSLKSYLEIGAGNLGYLETTPSNPLANFKNMKCELRIGVDPAINDELGVSYRLYKKTSDDFFNMPPEFSGEHFKFDLIFLDGDHTKEQAKKDFENSLRCLSDNGFIVIHDVLPENEEGTMVPRETKVWWGDVYKWAMRMSEYSGVNFKTFNIDNGCMLVWKDADKKGSPPKIERGSQTYYFGADWNTFKLAGKKLMNVTDEVKI